MKIKQVEELVGITSKNIRFYEDQGLLCPDRADNGYREYHDKDIKVLKQIKLLRKFGIPVEEIKMLFEGKNNLSDCLSNQLTVLKIEQENLYKMQGLASTILDSGEDIHSLNTDHWLDSVEKLETEGAVFVDLSKEDIHTKKKAGAILGGISISLVLIIVLSSIIYGYLTENMPVWVLILCTFVPLLTIICIIYAIKSRVNEINGGEEDEAAKY